MQLQNDTTYCTKVLSNFIQFCTTKYAQLLYRLFYIMFVRTVTEIKIINYFILHIIFETTSYAKKNTEREEYDTYSGAWKSEINKIGILKLSLKDIKGWRQGKY